MPTWEHSGREYEYDRPLALRRIRSGECPACGGMSGDCPICLGIRIDRSPTAETSGARLDRWRKAGHPVA